MKVVVIVEEGGGATEDVGGSGGEAVVAEDELCVGGMGEAGGSDEYFVKSVSTRSLPS